jgi:hypothetical protein
MTHNYLELTRGRAYVITVLLKSREDIYLTYEMILPYICIIHCYEARKQVH